MNKLSKQVQLGNSKTSTNKFDVLTKWWVLNLAKTQCKAQSKTKLLLYDTDNDKLVNLTNQWNVAVIDILYHIIGQSFTSHPYSLLKISKKTNPIMCLLL